MEAWRDAGDWYRTVKQLAVTRGCYLMTRVWDGLPEYRWLAVKEADDSRQGAPVGVDRQVNNHVRVGVGYNFTDFNDDLTDLDYQNQGLFINILGKL